MKRRLIVHIGNPKAGSSSIQKFFHENRHDFEADGIFYPIPTDAKRQSHSALAKHYMEIPLGPSQEALPVEFLEKMIAGTHAPIIVISSEYFIYAHNHPKMMRAMTQLIQSCKLDPTAIAMVRPQTFWLNSMYTQLVKSLETTIPFHQFVNGYLRRHPHYYFPAYDAWRKFGNFVAVPFSLTHLRPGLEMAFMRAAGFPDGVVIKYGQRPTTVTNASPGPLAIAALRMASARLRSLGNIATSTRVTVKRKIQRLADLHGWNKVPFFGLTNEIVGRIDSHFAEINDQFAWSAWGKGWLDVFPETADRRYESNEINRSNCSDEDWKSLHLVVALVTRLGGDLV
jgi:hypothetical protein